MFERYPTIVLWRIRRAKRISDMRFADRLIKAKALNRPDSEIKAIEAERFQEAEALDFSRALIETLQAVQLAQELRVPTPPLVQGSSGWVNAPSGAPVLTDTGIATLRKDIRAEQMARWDITARWIPLLTALTGLFGVVVGVLALIFRSGH